MVLVHNNRNYLIVCKQMCDTMGGIRFSVCGCQSENPFVYFGAKFTQRTCARDLPRDRKDEWMNVPEEDSRQERSVKRRTQSAEGSSRDQSAEGGSQKMKAGQRRENRGKKDNCLDLLTYIGRVNQREKMSALLVALWEYTLALAHRMHKKCFRLPPLVFVADPSLCLFVCSFLSLSRFCFAYQ